MTKRYIIVEKFNQTNINEDIFHKDYKNSEKLFGVNLDGILEVSKSIEKYNKDQGFKNIHEIINEHLEEIELKEEINND